VRALDFTSREHFIWIFPNISQPLTWGHHLGSPTWIKKAFLNTEYVEKVVEHQFKIISNADAIGNIWVA